MVKGLLVGVGLIAVLGIVAFLTTAPEGKVEQPIAFNHQKHVEKGFPCVTCHQTVEKAPHAGLPSLQVCLMCHSAPMTKSPEEEKIREYAKRGEAIRWAKIYKLPDNVYYSHRRHVGIGKLECKTCHGTIGESPAPPTRPVVALKMDWCLRCHRERKVETDCNACHK
ncbi:MAG: cytochrome c3 family protein [candidate division NC10 bacterium]|nr:cytochrome c3 family protein [candidate division NC10 bacterium]